MEEKTQDNIKEENKTPPAGQPQDEEKKQTKKKSHEKKSEHAKEIEKLEGELAAKNDLLLRTAAEFDNFKKRTEREKISISEYAQAALIKKILPIIDNIERSKLHESGSAEYIKGMELIIKQLCDLQNNLGITEIGQEGETFNPQFHEAVIHIEDPEKGENCVAAVLQKGYKIGDTVIRPAMVQVAN